ncbi:Uncharacterised protein [Streptococcus pneumoniae]|nr:Uncharacterised protein [Streptococcus pneumoniae]VRY42035.1 Uncharacterised protein [Streptococcus pneumoniae]
MNRCFVANLLPLNHQYCRSTTYRFLVSSLFLVQELVALVLVQELELVALVEEPALELVALVLVQELELVALVEEPALEFLLHLHQGLTH